MPFVQAKCPECGGMLAVDDSKKAAVCQFCGEAFIVQEAVINNNTYNNYDNRTTHNYGEGAVVNIYENKEKDFVIEGGVLTKYQGASVDVVIPDGVLEIASNCFRGLGIKSVSIPDSVTRIGYSAFAYCENLESVIIPYGVTRIDDYAFQKCIRLKSINIPNSVTMIGDCAFSFCDSLNSVTIPRNISYMGSSVFGQTPYEKIQKAEAKAKIEAKRQAEKQKLIAEWKQKGLCPYCGGAYKGLFTKKCAKCGRLKDASTETSVSIEGTRVIAPFSGKIIAINKNVGETVNKGDVIAILEALGIENDIVAPCDGVIKSIITSKGSSVNTDEILAII